MTDTFAADEKMREESSGEWVPGESSKLSVEGLLENAVLMVAQESSIRPQVSESNAFVVFPT